MGPYAGSVWQSVRCYEIANLFLKWAISRVSRSQASARVSPSICDYLWVCLCVNEGEKHPSPPVEVGTQFTTTYILDTLTFRLTDIQQLFWEVPAEGCVLLELQMHFQLFVQSLDALHPNIALRRKAAYVSFFSLLSKICLCLCCYCDQKCLLCCFFCTWLTGVPLSRKNVTIREFHFCSDSSFAFKQDLFWAVWIYTYESLQSAGMLK